METKAKKIDELNVELTITVAAADYAEAEKKKLNERRRNAEFKGFRKGMVPASLIKKVYGGECLADAVNDVLGTGIQNYIESENLNVLGEPLTSESQQEIEWVSGNDFTFVFDLGLSPEISLDVTSEDVVPQYKVSIAAADKKSTAENLKKYYEGQKQEKTDEEIDKEVTERLKGQLEQEAEWRLSKDVRNYLVEKAGVSLPEDFLKRWLFVANRGKVTKEDIEKDFAGFVEDFKWQLVRGYLFKKFEFKVEQKDITDAAEAFVTYQYAMYGMADVPAELIKDAVNNVLSDRSQVERLVEQVEDRKVLGKVRETITLKPTKIISTKFRELK